MDAGVPARHGPPMRLTSTMWVAAYVRRCHIEGAYAVVTRRGSPEAGAVFVVLDRLDGTRALFAQAPQSMIPDENVRDRLFVAVENAGDDAAVKERLARELKFDPDLWTVEVEDRNGRHFLELA
jgi:hypothetical protein